LSISSRPSSSIRCTFLYVTEQQVVEASEHAVVYGARICYSSSAI